MDINAKNIILLDDNREYVVVSKIEHKSRKYIYILEVDDPKNYKFAEVEGDEISIIEPDEKVLLSELIPLFGLDSKKSFYELLANLTNE